MIGNRSQGLRILSHSLVMLYMLVLYLVMELAWVHLLERLKSSQVNSSLYLLGIALAGFIAYRSKVDVERSVLPSFRWVTAMRQSNAQVTVLALVLFMIVFATKDKSMSRLFLSSYIVIYWLGAIPLNRYVPDLIAMAAFRGKSSIRTVFLGSAKSAQRLEDWAERQPFYGIDILGLVSYELVGKTPLRMPVIGDFMDLADTISSHQVDQVVLLETRNSDWWVDSVVEICEQAGCRILIYNQWEEFFDKQLIPVQQGTHTFFTVEEEPLENPFNRVLKRAIDIVIALGVLVSVLPFIALLVICMHRSWSPGPLFFRQTRSGQKGRTFQIYKFRSMHVGRSSIDETQQARVGDTRLFRGAGWLRKLSLDEFPQFINVLKGEMSVVGPRPHMTEHDDLFSQQVNIYRSRHFVKPGITGLAQSKGYRGEVTETSLIEERVNYDLQYIRNWSIWLDMWIVLKTVVQLVIPPKSAY